MDEKRVEMGVTPARTLEIFNEEKERLLFSDDLSLDESARVHPYTLAFDRAASRAGRCRYATWEIGISLPYIERTTEEFVRETIRHELAHAVTGPGHGHGAYWKDAARRVGSTGARTTVPGELLAPLPKREALWRWDTQGQCGCSGTRKRLTAKLAAGARCGQHGNLATWTKLR